MITSWLATEELVDAMCFHHPYGPLYSWKTPKGDKKGRLDHLRLTPKLLEYITRANYIYLGNEVTDHSSISFAVDIKNKKKGANPSLPKHPNYITLIKNIVYNKVLY